jgi:NADPH-dependent 2,4-dienoyl-CoA reductase/sulfur reductase-like enzyme
VFTITSLADAMRLRESLDKADSVAVIGAGYVGLEMTESLRLAGKSVTLFEREPHVLSSIDPDMARIVEYELQRHGVTLRTSSRVLALTGADGKVNGVKTASGLGVTPVSVALIDTGVAPNVDLAKDAGIRIGEMGGIAVDARMETNVPGVYAAGNCAETYCAIRRRPVRSYLGTVAAKQGRVAGDNLAGRRATFLGSVGTTVNGPDGARSAGRTNSICGGANRSDRSRVLLPGSGQAMGQGSRRPQLTTSDWRTSCGIWGRGQTHRRGSHRDHGRHAHRRNLPARSCVLPALWKPLGSPANRRSNGHEVPCHVRTVC